MFCTKLHSGNITQKCNTILTELHENIIKKKSTTNFGHIENKYFHCNFSALKNCTWNLSHFLITEYAPAKS